MTYPMPPTLYSRRTILKYTPVIILGIIAPYWLAGKYTHQNIARLFSTLLTPDYILPGLAQKFCTNHPEYRNIGFVEERMNRMLSDISASDLETKKDALSILSP
jgi:hypothetical protein